MEIDGKKITRYAIIAFGWLAVLYPVYYRFKHYGLPFNENFFYVFFPYLGLIAFSTLWLHSISGVFEPWLRKYINFDRYVYLTSTLIFICIIFHPLLPLLQVGLNFTSLFLIYGAAYIWFAIAGWLLLITYDIGKFLKKRYNFFERNWDKILLISNIGFILTFFHSLNIGSDLQSGPLRLIWIFYGVTAMLSIAYTYGIKRFLKSEYRK